MIEAAGGVVFRSRPRTGGVSGDLSGDVSEGCVGDGVEVVLIHRPHRGDWSLPKGKRRRTESIHECALREVHEETGLECRLGDELLSTHYVDRKGRPKIVRYWAMRSVGGEFAPNREVDEIRWLPIERVGELLTYERDLMVVAGLHRATLAFT